MSDETQTEAVLKDGNRGNSVDVILTGKMSGSGKLDATGSLELSIPDNIKAGVSIDYTSENKLKLSIVGEKFLDVNSRLKLDLKASAGTLTNEDLQTLINAGVSVTLEIDKNISSEFKVDWSQDTGVTGSVKLTINF